VLDGDNDFFSADMDQLRGASWRGRDCDDLDATVYPGRGFDPTVAPTVDANCNGIAGVNASSGAAYEALFCTGANTPMGVAILGDSAAAHFHLPPQYLNAQNFNLSGVLQEAMNEADWPQCSWSTGFRDTPACPTAAVPMNSIYQRLLARNFCAFRDLQNVGVNGARVGSMAPPGIINSFARNRAADAPVLVFFALIGNDVCDGHPGNGSWTSIADFNASVLASLRHLDGTLPPGSHVAFMPLADGRVLYDTMHNRTHPLGVTYEDLYEYLSQQGVNPCWGWLNNNSEWRNLTSAWAAELTSVYADIIARHSFASFDMHLLGVDWDALFADYEKMGGDVVDLIEPVDGFHPSQAGQQMLAEIVMNDLVAHRPGWLPAVNPWNWQIQQLFGDQGGY
jgi:acyloxyacyl hydrolase